jgi:hypothetical protein
MNFSVKYLHHIEDCVLEVGEELSLVDENDGMLLDYITRDR